MELCLASRPLAPVLAGCAEVISPPTVCCCFPTHPAHVASTDAGNLHHLESQPAVPWMQQLGPGLHEAGLPTANASNSRVELGCWGEAEASVPGGMGWCCERGQSWSVLGCSSAVCCWARSPPLPPRDCVITHHSGRHTRVRGTPSIKSSPAPQQLCLPPHQAADHTAAHARCLQPAAAAPPAAAARAPGTPTRRRA